MPRIGHGRRRHGNALYAATAGRGTAGRPTYPREVAPTPAPVPAQPARASAPPRRSRRVGLALLVAALAGVLLAALAFPLVGGVGLAAKAAADDFQALPAGIATPSLSLRSRVLAADGSLLATFYRVNRIEAPFKTDPAAPMRNAVVAIEDSRFYEHHGVDYKGTLRAAAANARSGGVVQGGSTLTQQYVKNALIEAANGDEEGQAAAIDQSVERKLREARYALALERTMSKDEILHGYLEIAYFGNGVYGIGTAAQYYFGKPVSKLTLAESATLAGVVQNPTRFNVASKDKDVRAEVVERRNLVLSRMRDLGMITEATRRKTAASKLASIKVRKVDSGCEAASVKAPFFCDQVRRELEGTDVGAALGATREERQNALFGGGLTIRTTLDPVVQKATQQAARRRACRARTRPRCYAAADVVEPGTGHIKAMAVDRRYGRRDKGETKLNFATGGSVGLPGRLDVQGLLPRGRAAGGPAAVHELLRAGGVPAGPGQVQHQGRERRAAVRSATPRSTRPARSTSSPAPTPRSTPSTSSSPRRSARRSRWRSPRRWACGWIKLDGQLQPLPRVCSSVLGSLEVSPLAMAGAFATFAASGVHCTPRAILSITDRAGNEVDVPETECGRVLDGRDRRQGHLGPARRRRRLRRAHRPGRLHRPAGRRQDRHDQRQPGGLVRRLHPAAGHGRLDRQVRLRRR